MNVLKPTVQIGKNKVNEGVIKEIKAQLKTKEYIKVKFLKSIKKEVDQLINQILKHTNAQLVERRGSTIILKKEDK